MWPDHGRSAEGAGVVIEEEAQADGSVAAAEAVAAAIGDDTKDLANRTTQEEARTH